MGKEYESYGALFVDNGIDGEALLSALSDKTSGDALLEKELGVAKRFHRIRILNGVAKLQAEAEKAKEQRFSKECLICLESERCMVFQPCAHVVCCEKCADQLAGSAAAVVCPVCKGAVQQAKKIFMC